MRRSPSIGRASRAPEQSTWGAEHHDGNTTAVPILLLAPRTAYNWANITLNFRVRGRQENARSSHTPREESHTTHASGGHGARASGISRSRSLPVRHRQPRREPCS